MELNKFYKIIYKDDSYTKICRGKLISEDDNLLCIEDIKDGKIWIGKSFIISIKEFGDRNGNQETKSFN